MILLLLLLNIHTSHFVSKIAADRSFPWFSHFSHTSQAWGLLFPSHYCPGPPSAQTGCSVSLSRYKTWAVKSSSTCFFSWQSFSYDSTSSRWTQICLESTSKFILPVVGLKKNIAFEVKFSEGICTAGQLMLPSLVLMWQLVPHSALDHFLPQSCT